MDDTTQKRAGTHHHGWRLICLTHLCHHTAHPIVFNDQALDQRLLDVEPRLALQHCLHLQAVTQLVRLGTVATYGRTFTTVQDAKLNAGFVNTARHLTAQGVDLAHQMPLGNTTDSGIARHQGNAVQVRRKYRCTASHTGRGQGRFTTSMASTDHNDLVRPRGCYACHGLSPETKAAKHYLPIQKL